jgi:hypothetical protein
MDQYVASLCIPGAEFPDENQTAPYTWAEFYTLLMVRLADLGRREDGAMFDLSELAEVTGLADDSRVPAEFWERFAAKDTDEWPWWVAWTKLLSRLGATLHVYGFIQSMGGRPGHEEHAVRLLPDASW